MMRDSGELFWPSLYSRLVPERYADNGRAIHEDEDTGPAHFLLEEHQVRRHIEIDLLELLNATCLEATLLARDLSGRDIRVDHSEFPFADYPNCRSAVINYGLPSLMGRQIYSISASVLQEDIRKALLAFEPRLDPASLRVEVRRREDDSVDPEKPIEFSVVADIYTTSESMKVHINSVWDLEKVRSDVKVAR